MKNHLLSFGVSLLTLAMLCQNADAEEGNKVALFDGKTLDGWQAFLYQSEAETASVWQAKEDMIVCSGSPMGYLHTKKKFKNFRLSLDYRWPPGKKPGNSGLLLRLGENPPSFLAKCVEVQLMAGSAGDLWGFYGFGVDGDKKRLKKVEAHKDLGDFQGLSGIERAEKAPGEWNHVEVEMIKKKLTVKFNGTLVNVATKVENVAGFIGLQSEGAEIHFRRIEIEVLK